MIILYDFEQIQKLLGDETVFRPQSYSFLFVKKGALVLQVPNQELHINDGQILIISPHVQYELIRYSENVNLLLTQDYKEIQEHLHLKINRFQIFPLIFFRKEYVIIPGESEFEWMWEFLCQIAALRKISNQFLYKKEIYQSVTEAFVLSLASVLQPSSTLTSNYKQDRKSILAEEFLALASQHYKTNRSLDFYANKQHVSKKYLSICVKDVTGISPSAILNQLTVDEAKLLLNNPENNIGDVAFDLGFADAFIFSKFFKRHTSISPSQYKQLNYEVHTI